MNFDELRQFMLAAHSRFHDLVPDLASTYPGLVPFSALDSAESVKGNMVWAMSVSPQIGEAINCVNDWCQQLHIWNIWLHVLPEMSSEQQWELESTTVCPVAFYCMLQPAANFDRLLGVVESVLHQANLIVVDGYKDRLEQDSLPAGRNLERKRALSQVDRLGEDWKSYQKFRDLFRQINGRDYRKATADFRNRAVHSFASRWTLGDIICADRYVGPWEDMVEQEDGGWQTVAHPTKTSVSYHVGARVPLDMVKMQKVNLKQYRLVRKTMGSLGALVSELVMAIHAKRLCAGRGSTGGSSP